MSVGTGQKVTELGQQGSVGPAALGSSCTEDGGCVAMPSNPFGNIPTDIHTISIQRVSARALPRSRAMNVGPGTTGTQEVLEPPLLWSCSGAASFYTPLLFTHSFYKHV